MNVMKESEFAAALSSGRRSFRGVSRKRLERFGDEESFNGNISFGSLRQFKTKQHTFQPCSFLALETETKATSAWPGCGRLPVLLPFAREHIGDDWPYVDTSDVRW